MLKRLDQALFDNRLQPGTYVRPHCHLRSAPAAAFECFVVLQGAIGLLLLDRQFHTLVALQPDSVMLEIKQGPYSPATDKDFLPGFPAQGSTEADQLVLSWSAPGSAESTADNRCSDPPVLFPSP
ncbi:hypothetical protein [Synechococcus sp. CS-603]|uniref:hypothetical protein n=1 Tax=Synechococcus sp. CS-603 TaxID=2847981 RepID=UPI00223B559B|nr:hypothetical protein [Synechococcus sp. CS-603]